MRRFYSTNSGFGLTPDGTDLPSGVPVSVAEGGTGATDAAGARTNLGVTASGSDTAYAWRANNLSDLASASAARTNLGLGNVENKSSATIRSEITSGNVTGALGYVPLNPANNLSDVASVATARSNLGVSASGADPAYLTKAANLSDLTNAGTARTNLGLGTAAVKNTGTSGNAVPLLDAASNTFSGNVGIGVAPSFQLDVIGTVNVRDARNLGSTLGATLFGGNASLNPYVGSNYAGPFDIVTNATGRMRIDTSGNVLINATAQISNEIFTVRQTAANAFGMYVTNSNPAPGSGYVVVGSFSAAAPNDGTSLFWIYRDTVGPKMIGYSNGGIGNYSANNVNLSDATVKTDITPYADADLDALETAFKAVDWGTFKYKDQTHADPNHGYTAQGVEAAFAGVAPELVDETDLGPEPGPRRKAVYDTDLTHIGLALLARALKRIADLEARLAAAGAA